MTQFLLHGYSYTISNDPISLTIVAEAYDNGKGKKRWYVNGIEQSNSPRLSDKFYIQNADSQYMYMFSSPAFYTDLTNSFIGKIYTARVYDRALSTEEIKQNYDTDKVRYGL